MPFEITVKGFGPKALEKLESDMRRATIAGMNEIAKKTAEYLAINIRGYGLIWRGTLLDSINVKRIKRSRIHIETVFWGPILEKGHEIPAGVRIPTLIAWARAKHPNPEAWLKKVFERGYYVSPRPFIRDSINAILPQVPDLMLLKMKRVK